MKLTLVLPLALGLLLIPIVFILGCPGERDNPLDPAADLPDPFQMQADLTPQGVQVEWQAVKVKGVHGYSIYRSTQDAVAGSVIGSVAATVTSYTDAVGSANTKYWYRVVATDAQGGESKTSLPDTVTIAGARLHVTPPTWQPGADTASLWVHIDSDSTTCRFTYTATSDIGWLTVSKSGGTAPDSLRMKVESSTSTSARTGQVVVTAPGIIGTPITIQVTQHSNSNLRLCFEPQQWQASDTGATSGEFLIRNCGSGTSGLRYNLKSDSAWLRISATEGTTPGRFTMTADWNVSSRNRSALVTAVADGPDSLRATLTVLQDAGPVLHVSVPEWNAAGDTAVSNPIVIENTGNNLRFQYQIVEDADWFSVSHSSGTVPDSFTIKAAWNTASVPRSGELTISAPGAYGSPFTIVVTQRPGPVLQVSPLAEQADQRGGACGPFSVRNVNGAAAFAYQVTSASPWLEPLPSSGIADDSFQIAVTWNDSGEARTGSVIVSAPGAYGSPDTITVAQEPGPVLCVSAREWLASAAGDTSNPIRIENCGNDSSFGTHAVPLGSSQSWLSTTYMGVKTPDSFAIAARRNTTGSQRIGLIEVTGANAYGSPDTVAVIQPSMNMKWTSLAGGVNGEVFALTIYKNQLIAGGSFTSAGAVSANYIAAWDGTNWSALGSGVDAPVYALTVLGDSLVAGGAFLNAGTTTALHVAAWDGNTWRPLGSGLDDDVLSLAVHDGYLAAAGDFRFGILNPFRRVARWNGSSWSGLGDWANSYIRNPGRALAVFGSKLVAGGDFQWANVATIVEHIAIWNGTSWGDLDGGLNGSVRALTVFGGELVAGGAFTSTYFGSEPISHLGSWNGSEWSSLGGGVNGSVFALASYAGRLYAGGDFSGAGSTSCSGVAAWDGSTWWPLSSGVNGPVRALVVFGNALVVAGSFSTAGDQAVQNIAVWSE